MNIWVKQFFAFKCNRFIWAAFLLSSVIALRPIIIFLNSSNEFSISLVDVAVYYGSIFFYTFLSLFLVGTLLNTSRLLKQKRIITSVMLSVAVLFWLQGNFFLWDYGKLDGKPLNFEAYEVHGLIEAFLWVALMALAVMRFEIVSAWAKKISIIILCSLLFSIVTAFIDKPNNAWHKIYHVTHDNYLTFSANKNVILLVLDAARGDVFEQMLSGMPENEKKIFNGFTFFRNTSGTFNGTDPAVSSFLTGIIYDCKKRSDKAYPELFTSSTSLPFQLKMNAFVTEVYPYNRNSVYFTPKIADNIKENEALSDADMAVHLEKVLKEIGLVARFNFSPHYIKKWLFDSSEMYVQKSSVVLEKQSMNVGTNEEKEKVLPNSIIEHINYNRSLIDKLGSELIYRQEPVFKYLHFHGAHPPFFHDENYIAKRLPFSMESYMKQYKGSLVLTLGALSDSLKRQGVYENTMLIVIGDHGLYIPEANQNSMENSKYSPVVASLSPLMMIKPFGDSSSPIKMSLAPVSLLDIPATIYEALGMNTQNVGRPVYFVGEDERRRRFAYLRVPAKGDTKGIVSFLEYEIDGDVNRLSSWKFTHQSLKAGEGKVQIDQGEYESKSKALDAYFHDTKHFQIQD